VSIMAAPIMAIPALLMVAMSAVTAVAVVSVIAVREGDCRAGGEQARNGDSKYSVPFHGVHLLFVCCTGTA
jgi:hypothetical protein